MSSLDDVFEALDNKKPKTEVQIPPTTPTSETKEEHEPTPEESPPVEASGDGNIIDDLWGSVPSLPEPVPVAKVEKSEGVSPAETVVSSPPTIVSAPSPSPPPSTPEQLFPDAPKTTPTNYDLSPDHGSPKLVITVYGHKGEGKTGLGLSFPGKIVALSFDHKTVQVWEEMYNRDSRILVLDAVRYLEKSSGEMWLHTANITFDYTNKLLEGPAKTFAPDWIIIDGAEIFTVICEMVMRFRNGLQPFQGVTNRNVWKERRMFIDQIHNVCVELAKQGVIYTTYTEKDNIVKDGEFVVIKDVPKWIDAIMYFTDVVIRVRSDQTETGRVFTAEVESSKVKKIPTGLRVNITDSGYKSLVK